LSRGFFVLSNTEKTTQGKPGAALVAAYTNSFRANDFKWVRNYIARKKFCQKKQELGFCCRWFQNGAATQGKPEAALVAAYTNSFRANDFKWVRNYIARNKINQFTSRFTY